MPNYQQTVAEIFDLQQFAIKLGLDNIDALMKKLDNPHRAYAVIHIAGTNGKGSTAFYLAKILEYAGLKTGLYTSPHLVDFRERIQVNGRQISEDGVINFWRKIKETVLDRKATFFDTTTAMAFNFFKTQQVDVAVIETGLGGRLDSTNIVSPELSVITPVHFDHEKQLGKTLKEIASEKAGIIKPCSIVISSEQEIESLEVLREKSKIASQFYYLPELLNVKLVSSSLEGMEFTINNDMHNKLYENIYCKQLGDFQLNNIALAYFACRIYMENNGFIFKNDQFKEVLKQNCWAGRLQLIQRNPNIIFDVSHNLIGINKTLRYLAGLIDIKSLYILIGLVQDKDYTGIARTIAQYCSDITITEPETHRKLDGEILETEFKKTNRKVTLIKDLNEAYDKCRKRLSGKSTLLVIGSHYLIGYLMKNKLI